jgi:hypothetical protein
MRINLRVEFLSGESKEVVCSASDLVKFEQTYDISVSRLEKDMKLTHLLFLAYSSLSRQKLTKETFEEWVDSVASIGASETDPK